MGEDGGEVVGEINPTGGSPTFTVIRRGDARRRPKNDCPHPTFEIEPEFRKVYCGKCGEELDAFWVIENWAKWSRRWKGEEIAAARAERQCLVAFLRRLHRLRSVTHEERAEIQALLDKSWSVDLKELRDTERRIERATRSRRIERRKNGGPRARPEHGDERA